MPTGNSSAQGESSPPLTEHSPNRLSSVSAPTFKRFVEEGRVERGLGQLETWITKEKIEGTFPIACPRGDRCVPAECPKAFSCGALPDISSGRSYILNWTLGAVGATTVLMGIIGVVVHFAFGEPHEPPPNLLTVIAAMLPFPVAAGLIALAYSFNSSRGQQGHIRALAGAARATGLRFLPLVTVPESIDEAAFPVISPPPPAFGQLSSFPRALVKLAATGQVDGSPMHLAQFMFHFDPNDYMPIGGAAKAMQTIMQPKTAWSRPEIWRMYLLTYFPERLSNVPDFMIAPVERGPETYFIRRQFASHLVSLPKTGHLNQYDLVMAEPQHTTSLGRDLLELLSHSPGWSIQVVAGRLLVWRDGCHPDWRFTLPQSADRITEQIQFAQRVRLALMRK